MWSRIRGRNLCDHLTIFLRSCLNQPKHGSRCRTTEEGSARRMKTTACRSHHRKRSGHASPKPATSVERRKNDVMVFNRNVDLARACKGSAALIRSQRGGGYPLATSALWRSFWDSCFCQSTASSTAQQAYCAGRRAYLLGTESSRHLRWSAVWLIHGAVVEL